MIWPAIIGAVGSIAGGYLSGKGKKNKLSSQILNDPRSQVQGGGYGVPDLEFQGGFDFDQWGKPRFNYDMGQFGPAAWGLLNQATQNQGQGATDLGWLQQLFQGGQGQMGPYAPTMPGVTSNADMLSGLSGMFSQGLKNAGGGGSGIGDPFALGAQATKALQAGAMPENRRAVNSAMDTLFSKGRLGATGGANQMGRLAEAQNKQDLDFQVAGFELGRGMNQDNLAARAMNLSQQAFGLNQVNSAFANSENMLSRIFGQQYGNQQLGMAAHAMGSDNFMKLFGAGGGLAQLLMDNQVQGQNMNVQGIGAASGLAQLGIPFQQLALQAATAQSNANLARAGVGMQQPQGNPWGSGLSSLGTFFASVPAGAWGGGGSGGARRPSTGGSFGGAAPMYF